MPAARDTAQGASVSTTLLCMMPQHYYATFRASPGIHFCLSLLFLEEEAASAVMQHYFAIELQECLSTLLIQSMSLRTKG
jgi:hypothetical protein